MIKGPSGSGKTTLLHLCSSLLFPTEGSIEIFGISSSPRNTSRIRRHVGYLLQVPVLIEHLSVKKNFQLIGEWKGMSPEEAVRQGREWLTKFDLAEFINQQPSRLSIGQRQRIALILSLLPLPRLLLLDEPLASIDHENREKIVNYLKELPQKSVTVLIATHSDSFDTIATTRYHLKDGSIVNTPNSKSTTATESKIKEKTN